MLRTLFLNHLSDILIWNIVSWTFTENIFTGLTRCAYKGRIYCYTKQYSSGPKERDIINNILNIQTILEYAEQNQESLALIS